GVFNRRGNLTITGSTIADNRTESSGFGQDGGGGLGCDYPSETTIMDSVISGNVSETVGGGIYCSGGQLTLSGSTVLANESARGGAVALGGGKIVISSSTISDNEAAGISTEYETFLTIRRSTVTGNAGSGLVLGERHKASIEASLFAGNQGEGKGRELLVTARGHVDERFNVFGLDGRAGVSGFLLDETDVVPARGILLEDIVSPLADNGGPTPTHALVAGSPALDVIPPADPACADDGTDQRGAPRPVGAGCDVGSFEL